MWHGDRVYRENWKRKNYVIVFFFLNFKESNNTNVSSSTHLSTVWIIILNIWEQNFRKWWLVVFFKYIKKFRLLWNIYWIMGALWVHKLPLETNYCSSYVVSQVVVFILNLLFWSRVKIYDSSKNIQNGWRNHKLERFLHQFTIYQNIVFLSLWKVF